MLNHPGKKYLIVVAGPTAVGKTATAIQIAEELGTEIISADSRQFYSELNIGVARPSEDELRTVKHHFIGHISITTPYTAADFEKDALALLSQLFTSHNYVVVAGGSGLFINALLNGLDDLPSDEELRKKLSQRLEAKGLQVLTEQLKQLDIESYSTIDINNPRRVIRALEICLASGKKASELRKNSTTQRDFTPIKIALNLDRELLYTRINQRVDVMMNAGLLKEVEGLLPHRSLNSLQTVGYKELFDYFDGKVSLNEAVELIKQHTRNYAKRQLTWFRKDTDYSWFEPTQTGEMLQHVKSVSL
ncbi:tRNA (adenosine(37)-N6)-dimethylallyltransferase MiaA [Oscillatoria amoena NRMC-F 0135]|nr:tRNA (adenosine(37)-N6)-dimethylallyltransferase MiaA [Oscillatoria amoena NRMC-F 0135]